MLPHEALAASLKRAEIDFETNVPMKEYTTFKIGGPAAVFCRPQSLYHLKQVLVAAREAGVPCFFLGKGSNVLFCDEGYNGLVLHLTEALNSIKIEENVLVAGAGAELGNVCLAASAAGLAGLGFAYGIPGSVGGAVFMNAGAFGGELLDVLQCVTFLDENLRVVTMEAKNLELGYRQSVFQKHPWCILSAAFALAPGNSAEIDAEMQRNMARRREKQPLEYPSAGSAFKRPEGAFAGELIDRCGFRGYRVGGAAISEKHCGFIVNMGGASCKDVVDLARQVSETVKEKTGFTLEKEIRVIGTEDCCTE